MSPYKQLFVLIKIALRRKFNSIRGLAFLPHKKKLQTKRNAVAGKRRTNIFFNANCHTVSNKQL